MIFLLELSLIEPVSAVPVGKELVVVQSRNSLTLDHQSVTIDVVVVWRIVEGRIVEVWDIVPGQPKTIILDELRVGGTAARLLS